MSRTTQGLSFTLAIAAAASIGCADSSGPTAQRTMTPGRITAASAERTVRQASLSIGLVFNGANANATTPLGTLVTTQLDDIAVDMLVRYDGPNATNSNQMIYINGHGGLIGWGIILLGSDNGFPDGSLAIIQSGIDIPLTPFVLTPGKWYNLYVERRAGVFTVALDGQVYNMGYRAVNPVGPWGSVARTALGGDGTYDDPTGDFHGAIGPVGLFDLGQNRLIELWTMSEGRGPTTAGLNGNVLHVGNATWLHLGAF